jgi:transposase
MEDTPMKLNKIERKVLYDCWRCGISIDKIAQIFSVSKPTVYRVIKMHVDDTKPNMQEGNGSL